MRGVVVVSCLALAVLGALGTIAALGSPALLPSTPWSPDEPVRWVHDPYDLGRYWELGAWGARDAVDRNPFHELGAEYPPIAIAFFGLLRALTGTPEGFLALFTAVVVAGGAALVGTTARTLALLRRSPYLALLLLLPASAYFVLNRFDVLAALPTLAALTALLGRRFALAGVLLGLGVGVKFFPIVLAPLFALAAARASVPTVPWYRSPFLAPFLSTAAACYLVPMVFWGPNVLTPVLFQVVRTATVGSFQASVMVPFTLDVHSVLGRGLRILFLATTLTTLLSATLRRLPAAWAELREALLQRVSAILVVVVLFNPFFSPQFLLWFVPFLLLVRPTPLRWWLPLLVAVDLTTYLEFPILYDAFGPMSLALNASAMLRSAAYLAVLILLLRPQSTDAPER